MLKKRIIICVHSTKTWCFFEKTTSVSQKNETVFGENQKTLDKRKKRCYNEKKLIVKPVIKSSNRSVYSKRATEGGNVVVIASVNGLMRAVESESK